MSSIIATNLSIATKKRQRREARIRENYDRISAALLNTDATKFAARNPTRVIPNVPGFEALSKPEMKKDYKEIERHQEFITIQYQDEDEDLDREILRSIRPPCAIESTLLKKHQRLNSWSKDEKLKDKEIEFWKEKAAHTKDAYDKFESEREQWLHTFDQKRRRLTVAISELTKENTELRESTNKLVALCHQECANGSSNSTEDSTTATTKNGTTNQTNSIPTRKMIYTNRDIIEELMRREEDLEVKTEDFALIAPGQGHCLVIPKNEVLNALLQNHSQYTPEAASAYLQTLTMSKSHTSTEEERQIHAKTLYTLLNNVEDAARRSDCIDGSDIELMFLDREYLQQIKNQVNGKVSTTSVNGKGATNNSNNSNTTSSNNTTTTSTTSTTNDLTMMNNTNSIALNHPLVDAIIHMFTYRKSNSNDLTVNNTTTTNNEDQKRKYILKVIEGLDYHPTGLIELLDVIFENIQPAAMMTRKKKRTHDYLSTTTTAINSSNTTNGTTATSSSSGNNNTATTSATVDSYQSQQNNGVIQLKTNVRYRSDRATQILYTPLSQYRDGYLGEIIHDLPLDTATALLDYPMVTNHFYHHPTITSTTNNNSNTNNTTANSNNTCTYGSDSLPSELLQAEEEYMRKLEEKSAAAHTTMLMRNLESELLELQKCYHEAVTARSKAEYNHTQTIQEQYAEYDRMRKELLSYGLLTNTESIDSANHNNHHQHHHSNNNHTNSITSNVIDSLLLLNATSNESSYSTMNTTTMVSMNSSHTSTTLMDQDSPMDSAGSNLSQPTTQSSTYQRSLRSSPEGKTHPQQQQQQQQQQQSLMSSLQLNLSGTKRNRTSTASVNTTVSNQSANSSSNSANVTSSNTALIGSHISNSNSSNNNTEMNSVPTNKRRR